MPGKNGSHELTPEELRWRLDPAALGFSTTDELTPLDDIIGQKRGVEAFTFGMGLHVKGYNIFVTGPAGYGRLATVKKLLTRLSGNSHVPDDLCYVNNFKNPEAPVLLRFSAGEGAKFKKAVHDFVENIRREVPLLFESEEYVSRKREIMEAHEKQVREFFKSMEDRVKDTGLVVVTMQIGPFQRPELVPVIDGEPKRFVDVEELVDKGRFPKDEFVRLVAKRDELQEQLDHIVEEVKSLQKEVRKKHEEVDRLMFMSLATEFIRPVREAFPAEKINDYCEAMLEHMVDNLGALRMAGGAQQMPGPMQMMAPPPELLLQPYQVNLLVDNAEQSGPPVIVESYPTYRNLFGSIERVMDRMGGWRTDYTKIKAGSFVKANGGYLVLNLMDAIIEPGVWQTLKRALKTEHMEIETYDPYYFISATGLKPEPIKMDVKVVVLGDPYLYTLLQHYDPDTSKIFKVRADYATVMDKDDEAIANVARFVKSVVDENKLLPFEASAVALVVEQAVRMAGRVEKLSTAFPRLGDLLSEAELFAKRDSAGAVAAKHVQQALEAREYRSNQIEERIQEMIDRGSLFVDTEGSVVGQVNGLAVYSMGDYAFGKPSRITAATSLGKEGIINIEREAEMSGPSHNKGVLILSGYLRRKFAQDKPMALAASIAFEQSYGGVDGDSASSTELYAILSSLSDIPIRQEVAVTGSVNQKGEVQPIGGVNEKIEGYYQCCRHKGLTGTQGVMIPRANVKDLMLKPEVVQAVQEGKFHIHAVATIEEGIEILTGAEAGTQEKDGAYPADSVFGKADATLRKMVETLKAFSSDDGKEKKREGKIREEPEKKVPPRK